MEQGYVEKQREYGSEDEALNWLRETLFPADLPHVLS